VADDPALTLALDLCASPECLEKVHGLLEQLWDGRSGVDLAERMRFELAVAEVAANIVEHAAGAGRDPVDLNLRLTAYDDRVEARFRDTGQEATVDVGDASLPADDAEAGRGLAIALAAVDEVTYQRDGDVNCWLVVLRHG
jgi:serine/threonine-protein kinase RsbW